MAPISLDRQVFFTPPLAAGGKPTSRSRSPRNGGPSAPSLGGEKKLERDTYGNRRGSTGPSQPDVVLISSDSDSDYGDLDNSQSDTSSRPVDEFLPLTTYNVESGSIASTGKRFNLAFGGNSDAKEPAAASIASSGGQTSEPPTRAAVQDGSKEPSPAQMMGPMRPTASSPTNGVESPPEASPVLRNSNTACDTRVPDTPGPSLVEDAADLHRSGLQLNPGPIASSRRENSHPRENSACLDPADQADEWDKKYPFSLGAVRRRLHRRRVAGLSQQRTRSPERSPIPLATALPRRLSGPPRAVQQDEPVPEGFASCEAKQTSPHGGTTCGSPALEMTPATDGACRTSDATESCGEVNSGQHSTTQTQTTLAIEQLQAPPPTPTIPEGLLEPSGAQRKEQDLPSPADTAPCEAGQASEDTTRSVAAKIANAVSSGTRRETLTVDVQSLSEGIESGQGGGWVEAMQASNGKQGSPPPLRCQDPVSGGSGNSKSQQRQVKLRRSLRKAAQRRRITDLTEDEDDDMAGTGGKNSSQTRLRRRRRRHGSMEAEGIDMYQPSEGGEKEQDDGGDDIPLPPRKRHRTATGRQIRSVGDIPGSRPVHTSHLTQEHSRRNIPSPPYSQGSDSSDSEILQASFQEWPLGDAVLKRAVMNDVATFQLQFTWPCVNREHKADPARGLQSNTLVKSHLPTKRRMGRTAWTLEEENLVVELKEQGLEWNTICKRFNEAFPETDRRVGSLQVRYCTKLRKRQ